MDGVSLSKNKQIKKNNKNDMKTIYYHDQHNEEIINLLKKNGAKEKNLYIDKSEEIDKNLFKNLGMNFNINVNEIEVELLEKAIPVGLKNIHGSCYFNTVLQCLFHIKKLSLYFLKKKKKFENYPFSKAYLSVIHGFTNNSLYFEPNNFKDALIAKNQNYKSFGSDPKDVIMDFIFYMNEELLEMKNELSLKLNNIINKCNQKKLFEYYIEEFERTKTIITELFGWFKQTRRKCKYCKKNTFDFIFELYFNFSLQKIYNNTNRNKYERKLKLIECFKFYFKNEKKNFTCQNSQCNHKENKNGDIDNKLCVLPEYLIIILDRGKDDKFNCHVDFDYELDLKEVTEQIEDIKYNTKYDLIGATFLYGSSGAGHTVAFCKHFDNKYYLFDDSICSEKKLENLKNNKAFLLFYERKNN